MTLSSKSPAKSPHCPLNNPLKGPPILDTLLIKIWMQHFQVTFLGVKYDHQWPSIWHFAPSLHSGTFNVLQVTPSNTMPPQTHHAPCDGACALGYVIKYKFNLPIMALWYFDVAWWGMCAIIVIFKRAKSNVGQHWPKKKKRIWKAQNLRILGKKREGIVTFKIGDFCNLSYFYTKTSKLVFQN